MATQTYTDGVTLSSAAEFNRFDTVSYAVLSGVAGTNTITATGPANYTYAATTPPVWFIPANTNTGATTINITPSGGVALGAKNVFANGAALSGGEIRIGVPCGIVYDGTQFNILGPYAGGLIPGNLTVNGNATLGDAVGDAHAINGETTFNDDGTSTIVIGQSAGASSKITQTTGDLTIKTAANNTDVVLDGKRAVRFYINGVEEGLIDSTGNILVGKATADGGLAVGVELGNSGYVAAAIDGTVIYANRLTSDGDVIAIMQGGTLEGSISVSGTTVSYNAFLGSHWSQLVDGSRDDTILPGTVMQTIDALCEWPGEENDRLPKCEVCDTPDSERVYGVFLAWDDDEFRDVEVTEDIEEPFSEVQEIDGKFVMVNGTRTVKRPILTEHPLVNEDGTPHLVKVRDAVYEGKERKKVADEVWQQATHQKPVMVKRQGVNDMYVAALGQYRVRLRKGEAFQNGDLVVAAGGGCAKVNNDAKPNQIIGKINCAVVIELYSDGSFTVPCALYCG